MPFPVSPVRRTAGALAAVGIATCLAVGAAPAAHAAPTSAIGVTTPATVEADATFEVTVDASAAEDVFAYELEITYDAALLTLSGDPVLIEGGFDDVERAEGSLTLVHTRLGSSPALGGDLALASLAFDAIAGGDAAIEVAGTLVGADGETLSADASQLVTIESAAETPPPETETPSPDETETAAPADPADPADPSGPADPTTADDSAPGGSGDDLAATGGEFAWLAPTAFGLGIAALASGALLLLRRKAVRA